MQKPKTENDEKPPVLGSWKNLYILLLGALILQVVVYYLITIAYR